MTRAQVDSSEGVIDWFPGDHPPAPAIVGGPALGGMTPCAACHAFNGAGFPGSAPLAGLSAGYIVEQLEAFRSGDRKSANPGQPDTAGMIDAARSLTPKETAEAAAYFAHLPPHPWVRVIETATVPRTVPDEYGWLDPAPGGGTEPVGDRVVELSDDMQLAFLGDDHITLTDYAPDGAVARGKVSVMSGGTPCGICHGGDLRGTAVAPPLAGRPAAYIARTLWDIRVGARRGPSVVLMQRPARALSAVEIRDVAAYLASLKP